MGLLGAIMLFSLQEAARSIARAAQQLAEHPHPTVNAAYIKHVVTRRSFHELARIYGQVLESPDQKQGTSVELLAHHATLTWELDHDAVIRKAFRTALKSSGLMIALAIALCGAAPHLAAYERVGTILLLVSILGAIGCLVLYGILLRILFRAQAEVTGPG